MEREFDAEAVIVRFDCDEHGCDGELVRHGSITKLSDPPQIPHRCSKCGAIQDLADVYPKTVFRQR